MLKAALLDTTETTIVQLENNKMANIIDPMLYHPSKKASCFHYEVQHTNLQKNPPSLAKFLSLGAKVYAIVGNLNVQGCIVVDGDYIFSFCITKPFRGKGLGTKLLRHVLNLHGKTPLNLSVFNPTSDHGKNLIAYYTKYGFVSDVHNGKYLRMIRPPD